MSEEKTDKQSWLKIKPPELEKIIIELAEQGNTPSKIGIVLRDKYGIPKAKILGKKITKILKDENIHYIKEKDIVARKIERLKKHILKHKHNYTAKKSLEKQLWRQYRLNQ